MFEILGWSFTKGEVSQEERVSDGYVDYGFTTNGVYKMFVEAKKTANPLSDEKDMQQAIGYALSRATTWAVLTNFKRLIVFNSEVRGSLREARVLDVYAEDYEKQFDRLWMLSKEGFEQELLDKYAEGICKKATKRPIEAQLFNDLNTWRELLAKDIKKKYEAEYKSEVMDEIIQTLLNRFILIRKIEDSKLENKKLEEALNSWASSKTNKSLWHYVKEIFAYFDENYDSKIFDRAINELDRIEITDYPLKIIIPQLYTSADQTVAYNFKWIPADVLGNIYEQYLGSLLKTTDKRAKVSEGKTNRKEQGIYYTPTYIVDYIVKNTLAEKLKECKKPDEVDKIKILDPACGSGSFLIRAFDEIYGWYKKNGFADETKISSDSHKGFETVKDRIIRNNLFGVDLDQKAVEIAQLNLLLKTADKKHKLPQLKENIKHGNSLIDDKNISQQAFDWKNEFEAILESGGFDVVIGNPPYIKSRDAKNINEREYIEKCGDYETTYKMWDMFIPFVERGIKLLKPDGYFGMIIPDTIGRADYTEKLVNLIVNKYYLYQIDFFPEIKIFENVGVENKIIFVSNGKKKNCKRIIHEKKMENSHLLDIVSNPISETFTLEKSGIKFKFEVSTVLLGEICYVSYGLRLNSDKSDPRKFTKKELVTSKKDATHNKKYLEGKFISRYKIDRELYVEWGTERCPGRLVRPTFPELYSPKKILLARQKRVAALSEDGHICDNTIIVAVPYAELKGVSNRNINKYLTNVGKERAYLEETSRKFDIFYLLGLINSKLTSYFLKFTSTSKIDVYPDDWKIIQIADINLDHQKKISDLVKRILTLNKELKEIGDKQTSRRQEIEDDIKKTDAKIDEFVYKIYGITEQEKKVIEDSFK